MSHSASSLGLGGKLRSMLDRQKYAIFQVDVTLHELGNVPQLEGEFAVRWRFRGKRPKARDAVHRELGQATADSRQAEVDSGQGRGSTEVIGLHGHGPSGTHKGVGAGHSHSVGPSPKPSLPNLKLSQPSYPGSLHPSTSSISLRSSSTGGSSSIRSGQYSLHGPSHAGVGAGHGHGHGPGPHKSMSTPPLGMTSLNSNGGGKGHPNARVEKKGSDPTPLRQSVRVGPELETVESPPSFDADADAASIVPSGESTPLTARQPSRSSTLPPTHPLATSSTYSARPSTVNTPSGSMPGTGPSSASSSATHLSVPQARSSTTPSPLERTGSQLAPSVISGTSGSASTGSQADLASLGVRNGDRPVPRRIRSSSGTSLNATPQPLTSATMSRGAGSSSSTPLAARHGVTAGRPLKSHTCTWDHDLQLALRLPISKDRPTGLSKAPVLGEGSDSSSGLRLIIEQLPTAGATSAAHSKTSDPALRAHSQTHSKGGEDANTGGSRTPSVAAAASAATTVKGERTVFGKVDIDLAAFAGRGKTTRKFLLGGSRTNATVKLTVEMTWIGGDGKWVA